MAGWIDRLGAVWVEGQLTQINIRPNTKTVFMVLRDPAADMSLSVTCPRDLVLAAPVKLTEGTQVVVCVKPSFFTGRGTFSLQLSEIRAVGSASYWPGSNGCAGCWRPRVCSMPASNVRCPSSSMVGLITGRASAAEHDVTTVCGDSLAWRFALRSAIPLCGGLPPWLKSSMPLRCLDADPAVDVIIIERWGAASKIFFRSPTRHCVGPSPRAGRRW